MKTLHITLVHKTDIPYCKTKVCITYPPFYATWRLFKLNKNTDHVMVRVNCSFKNMTWNIFAAGIPVRVWLLGCLGLDKNSPQVSIHPSNNLTLSVILSFFVSPSLHLQRGDLPVFTLSLGGGGLLKWGTDVTSQETEVTSVKSLSKKQDWHLHNI